MVINLHAACDLRAQNPARFRCWVTSNGSVCVPLKMMSKNRLMAYLEQTCIHYIVTVEHVAFVSVFSEVMSQR